MLGHDGLAAPQLNVKTSASRGATRSGELHVALQGRVAEPQTFAVEFQFQGRQHADAAGGHELDALRGYIFEAK